MVSLFVHKSDNLESIMASKKNHVVLDQDQHVYLKKMITSGTESARKLTHARILLKADKVSLAPLIPINRFKNC